MLGCPFNAIYGVRNLASKVISPVGSGDDLGELCKIAPQIESTNDIFIDWGHQS